MVRPIVLTIAGSDCSGGAGIQADLKAIESNGGYGATVLTAVTAQSTRGVRRVAPLAPDLVGDQLDAVFSDLNVAAVKSGMLVDGRIVAEVASALRRHRPRHYVCDPVLRSTSGHSLLESDALERLKRELLPLASLVTPNVPEAELLTGLTINSVADAERAAGRLLEFGPDAVLVTGGHLAAGRATDVLATRDGCTSFPGEVIAARQSHGSGCSHAAAIATALARGLPLVEAISAGKRFVTEAIRHGLNVGRGSAVTDPFYFLHRPGRAVLEAVMMRGRTTLGRLHVITDETLQSRFGHAELARLSVEGGADTVQYRDKRPVSTAERVSQVREVQQAIGRVPLVVNDRIDVALACGAQGVHLGRRDLDPTAARELLGVDRWIGVTVNAAERVRALRDQPIDYFGVGPVFGTSSKQEPAPQLGLERLRRIVLSTERPIIAIGGITPENVGEVLETGVHGVAVLSAVVCRPDPVDAAGRFREAIARRLETAGSPLAAEGSS
jgi:hydroxymethylpyrimidine kinase/phosphomethylpyrimidine kinase/thiamine-phosphate diphosphorylase